MINLLEKKCLPCEGGVAKMTSQEAEAMLAQIDGWIIEEGNQKIFKEFKFKNFIQAMDMANKITVIAEAEGHHPDLSIGWGYLKIELSTHAIHGLSENDFILAAKIDEIESDESV